MIAGNHESCLIFCFNWQPSMCEVSCTLRGGGGGGGATPIWGHGRGGPCDDPHF